MTSIIPPSTSSCRGFSTKSTCARNALGPKGEGRWLGGGGGGGGGGGEVERFLLRAVLVPLATAAAAAAVLRVVMFDSVLLGVGWVWVGGFGWVDGRIRHRRVEWMEGRGKEWTYLLVCALAASAFSLLLLPRQPSLPWLPVGWVGGRGVGGVRA